MSMEQSKPILSVVIPVYNAEPYLQECLQSIREQTFTQWEAFLVDDGSTDGSAAVCTEAAAKDARFHVIRLENAGVSGARNAGIEAAQGKYLMFIDADDLVMPDCFRKMIDTADTYTPDLVLSGYERFRDDWKQEYRFTRYSLVLMRELPQFLMSYTEARINMFGVSIWAKLYRMDLLRKYHVRFNPEISYEEDCDFNVSYLYHTKTVAAVGDILYRYRQLDESLSKSYRKDTFRFLVHGFQRRCKILEDYGLGEFRPNAEGIFLLVIKAACIKIVKTDLPAKEKREEYRMILSFPESQAAVRYQKRPKSGLTRNIARAVRLKSPRLLACVMDIWKLTDRIVHLKNTIVDRIKNGKQTA